MDQPELEIEDLIIRPWQASDAEAVFEACQDPEIQRWTSVPKPYLLGHATWFVTFRAGWDEGTSASFGVFDRDDGQLLASMGLVDWGTDWAELGYWTTPAARGRGVATRAGRALATWAFELLGIDRLIWRADVCNHASRLVARRIGFSIEGTVRHALRATDNSGRPTDGWTGTMLAGEVLTRTPDRLGSGSVVARQARAFSSPMPRFDLTVRSAPQDSAPQDSAPGTSPEPRRPGTSSRRGGLRPLTEADVDPLTEACQDPETQRWTTVPVPYRRADAESFVGHHAPDMWREGRALILAITDADDRCCGAIDLRVSPGDPEVGEVGFSVAPWARGQGLAPAAVRTLCDWGFSALGLQRIVWRAHVGNDASRRVAEKAGFTIEGVQRLGVAQRGERRDAWVGALLATDTVHTTASEGAA